MLILQGSVVRSLHRSHGTSTSLPVGRQRRVHGHGSCPYNTCEMMAHGITHVGQSSYKSTGSSLLHIAQPGKYAIILTVQHVSNK